MAAGSYQPISPFSSAIYERGTVELLLKASQTFKRGAPLVSNGGYFEEAGTAPSTVAYIAAEDAVSHASDGGENVLAYRVVAGDQWEISFEDSVAVADHLANYGLVKDATSGFWFVDDADAGDQVSVIRFVQTPSLGAVGDTKARGIVEFQTGNIAGA
jgi:hypothetical protein